MNLCNYEGDTPLHIACKNNSYQIAEEYLYSKLCRFNEPNKRTGETTLHYTCARNYLQLTKLLLKQFQDIHLDIDVQAYNGCTPLHMAIANRNYLVVRLLVKANASIYIQSIESIHGNYVVQMKSAEVWKELKKVGSPLRPRIKFKPVIGESDAKQLTDKRKLAESSVIGERTEKMAVETAESFNDETQNSGVNSVGVPFFINTHCYDAFSYAKGDKLMLKLLGTFKSDLYLPKEEVNVIMDFELKKKVIQKMNLSYLKLTSKLETSQIDFINAIEHQMKSLNEDFKLKMRVVNNETNEQVSIKRRTTDNVDKKMETANAKKINY